MKTRILFSTLFAASLFTACTSDDLLNEAPKDASDEVVGATLLGKGLSLSVDADADTRITDGQWEEGDVIGLGWFVKGSYGAEQTYSKGVTGMEEEMAINHRFAFSKNDGKKFQTASNIYEGWHLAYSPFAYTKQSMQSLTIPLNALPMTKESYTDDALACRPAVSAKDYLKGSKINQQTGQINTQYTLVNVAHQFRPVLDPSTRFTQDGTGVLNTLKVEEIELSAIDNATTFTTGIEVDPNKVPEFEYGWYANDGRTWQSQADFTPGAWYNADLTREKFKNSLFGAGLAFIPSNTVSSISRQINCSSIMLDGTHPVNIYLNQTNITADNLQIKVYVECGYFTITKQNIPSNNPNGKWPEARKAAQRVNNATIDAFVTQIANAVMESDGKPYGAKGGHLMLIEEDFTPVFDNIDSEAKWNRAVSVVNALGTNAWRIFTLSGNVNFAGNIEMPTTGSYIQVRGNGNLVINGQDVAFPEKINCDGYVGLTVNGSATVSSYEEFKDVYVNEGATLNITNRGTVNGKSSVSNYGTINVDAISTLAANDGSGTIANEGYLGNGNSRHFVRGVIDVKYGSYVKSSGPVDGIVQYRVTNTTKAYQINNMISAGSALTGLTARVNTLVVENGLTLDLNKEDAAGEIDPYTGATTGAAKLGSLENVNIFMNGGVIKGNETKNKLVGNVEVYAGTNRLDIVTAKDVQVFSGATLNIKNDTYKDETPVTAVTGNLTNKGTVVVFSNHTYKKEDNVVKNYGYSCITIGNVVNDGQFSVSKVRVTSTNVTNNSNGNIVARKIERAEDTWLHCTKLTNNGSISGDVKAN